MKNRITGITLVELVAAVIIIGLIASAFTLTLREFIRGVFETEDAVYSLNLSRMELEKLGNTAYASIVSGFFRNYEASAYDLRRGVVYLNGSASSAESLKKVTLEVYNTGETKVVYKVSACFAKNINYGL